jgi:hypothetical protein
MNTKISRKGHQLLEFEEIGKKSTCQIILSRNYWRVAQFFFMNPLFQFFIDIRHSIRVVSNVGKYRNKLGDQFRMVLILEYCV